MVRTSCKRFFSSRSTLGADYVLDPSWAELPTFIMKEKKCILRPFGQISKMSKLSELSLRFTKFY